MNQLMRTNQNHLALPQDTDPTTAVLAHAIATRNYDMINQDASLQAKMGEVISKCGGDGTLNKYLDSTMREQMRYDRGGGGPHASIVPGLGSLFRRFGCSGVATPIGWSDDDWEAVETIGLDTPLEGGVSAIAAMLERLSNKPGPAAPRFNSTNFAGGAGTVTLTQAAVGTVVLFSALVAIFSGTPNSTPAAPVSFNFTFLPEGGAAAVTTPTMVLMPDDLVRARPVVLLGYFTQGGVYTPVPIQNLTAVSNLSVTAVAGPANLQVTLMTVNVGSTIHRRMLRQAKAMRAMVNEGGFGG